MWKELQQKINDSPVRIEWSSDGQHGKGKLTKINITNDYIEFFITDDKLEVGSFSLKSLRSMVGFSPQEGEGLNIFLPMGNITILCIKIEL